MRRPEQDLQVAIVNLLQLYENQGYLRFYHVPNQLPRPSMLVKLIGAAKVAMIYAMIENVLRKMGKRPGVPDLVVLMSGGSSVLFECKAKDGRVSKEQSAWHSWLNGNGFDTHVVTTVEEVQLVLKPHIAMVKTFRRAA